MPLPPGYVEDAAPQASAPPSGYVEDTPNSIESHRIIPQGHQPTEFEQEHPTLARLIKGFGMSAPLPGMAEMPLPGSGAMLAPAAIRAGLSAYPATKWIPKVYDAAAAFFEGAPKSAEMPSISPEEYYRGQSSPIPSAEDYYSNQGVKAAEVPPQSAPSAPAPTPASAASSAKVQPIRPEPAPAPAPEPAATPEPPQPRPASGATAAKSARYADAISKWAKDMGMTPKDIADQWGTTTPEVRGQILLELKRNGYLGANETIPKTSAQGIVDALKAKAATIKPPAGFGMGSMGTRPTAAAPSAVPAPAAATVEPPAAMPAEAPAASSTSPQYKPDMQIHGMQYYDKNLYELVQHGEANNYGMPQKIYRPVLREDTTSASTRTAWDSYEDAVKRRDQPRTITMLRKRFEGLLEQDKQALAAKQ